MGYDVDIVTSLYDVTGKLVDYPDVDVGIDVPDEADDMTDYEIYLSEQDPRDPHVAYQQSMLEMERLIEAVEPHTAANPTFSRMAFVSYIAIMEAYLCDSIISLAKEHQKLTFILVRADASLAAMTYGLKDILQKPAIVEETLKESLKNRLYHDLEKVALLYRPVLGKTDFFPSEGVKEVLTEAVKKRHDCVHRNGKTKAGDALVEINENYVQRISIAVEALVSHLERLFNNVNFGQPG